MPEMTEVKLPGLNCGLCGFKYCEELERELVLRPELLKRCIQISDDRVASSPAAGSAPGTTYAAPPPPSPVAGTRPRPTKLPPFIDTLGRDFDFYLEHFPEDPGPREIIIPHNPMITRELPVKKGDILIGRPLGMSCGCPITHCGVAMEVDQRTGVIVWCVTGPLAPRSQGFKDLGYYIAEGYEGLITEAKAEIKIGCRYFFQPRMCMLQWRHSGLVNFINRTPTGIQVRVEGLWIG
jgi:uncharacterized Fe-S cluster-containing protein